MIARESIVFQDGSNSGLRLILDMNQRELEERTINRDTTSFLALIASKNRYPQVEKKALLLDVGGMHNIRISPVQIDADDSLRHLTPEGRECYFPDEFDLEVFFTLR